MVVFGRYAVAAKAAYCGRQRLGVRDPVLSGSQTCIIMPSTGAVSMAHATWCCPRCVWACTQQPCWQAQLRWGQCPQTGHGRWWVLLSGPQALRCSVCGGSRSPSRYLCMSACTEGVTHVRLPTHPLPQLQWCQGVSLSFFLPLTFTYDHYPSLSFFPCRMMRFDSYKIKEFKTYMFENACSCNLYCVTFV